MINRILEYISLGIGSAGAAIVLWGAVIALVELFKLEYSRTKKQPICRKRETLRHHLGSYILLGLEFLIAADVVHSLIKPTLAEIAILGGIVTIRTVLSFFLTRELADHNCEKKMN
ncbi:DUF1622 domain-containing protein [bacterium]|nr:DUF1622 domain-containing protein [bacterium]